MGKHTANFTLLFDFTEEHQILSAPMIPSDLHLSPSLCSRANSMVPNSTRFAHAFRAAVQQASRVGMVLLAGAILAVALGMVGTAQAAQEEAPFITTWETEADEGEVTISTRDVGVSTYNFTIDWGDGTVEEIEGEDPNPSHTYETAGTYTVEITGTFPRIYLNEGSDSPFSPDNAEKLQSIDQWGDIEWESMRRAFAGATNLTYEATDTPDLSSVTDMSEMFDTAESFNGDLGDWDVSGVIDMRKMFYSAESFNQDLSDWDVSNVVDMSSMFGRAEAFNRDIGDWETGNVENMSYMFEGGGFSADPQFNQDISEWDVSSVTDMEGMFNGAESFNQDISEWDVSSVDNMERMFSGARSFNQDLVAWDVSSVTNMERMFASAESFDQALDGWDVSSVTNMREMFRNTESFDGAIGDWDVSSVEDMGLMFSNANSFNHNLNDWDVSSVIDMSLMFRGAESFDEDLSGWDLSSVQTMSRMFAEAESFNQDLSDWDVSNVQDMGGMFGGATSFDQDLSDWDVSNVWEFDWEETFGSRGFLEDAGLSPSNYDALLKGWESLDLVQGLSFDAGASQYTAEAEEARQAIIDEHEWTISDGGLTEEAEPPVVVEDPSDRELVLGEAPAEIDLTAVFEDPLGEGLSFEAVSSSEGVVEVAVSEDTLTVDAVGAGAATVTATAENADGTAEASFEVTVEQMVAEVSRTFDDPADNASYRLVGLPGEVDVDLAETVVGESGPNWRAFRELGADDEEGLEEYDGSEDFHFRPGRGFWVIAQEEWAFDGIVPVVEGEDGVGPPVIELQAGWNVISNPVDSDLPWELLRGQSDLPDDTPLWRWDGSWIEENETLATARGGEAYYLYSEEEIDLPLAFLVERPPPEERPGDTEAYATEEKNQKDVHLEALVRGERAAGVTVGLAEGESEERWHRTPPDHFESVSLRIDREGEAAYGRAFVSADSDDGATVDLMLRGEPGVDVELRANDLTTASSEAGTADPAVMLMEPEVGSRHDLREKEGASITIGESGEEPLQLALGSESYIENEVEREAAPGELALHSPYPNPSDGQVTVGYALPEDADVRIAAFNALGQQVAVLDEGTQAAGTHEVQWSAQGLASGTYFIRLKANGQTDTQQFVITQ